MMSQRRNWPFDRFYSKFAQVRLPKVDVPSHFHLESAKFALASQVRYIPTQFDENEKNTMSQVTSLMTGLHRIFVTVLNKKDPRGSLEFLKAISKE